MKNSLAGIRIKRRQIDQVDRDLAFLLKKRIQLSQKVIAEKKLAGNKVVDRKREAQVLANYAAKLGPTTTKPRLKKFLGALLQLNPRY